MEKRRIVKTVRGQRAVDGAGVQLTRVLGNRDVEDFDPFLMLDSFDSTNPSDYTAGFPTHPHRGIETVTYLISGEIEHEDSLGNRGSIAAGESQWMTAGSGILHQEMPQASDRILGFQLWLNLPKSEKMAPPAYLSITGESIARAETEGAEILVLSGSFGEAQGVTPRHIPATIYDILLKEGGTLDIPTKRQETAFVFTIEGGAVIDGQAIPPKTAVLLGEGDYVSVSSGKGASSRLIFFSGQALHEPIAWGGPIVMNTEAELRHAFDELRMGTFIKHK